MRWVLCLALVVAAVGCSSADDDPGLDGRTFVSTEVVGRELDYDTRAQVMFDDGVVTFDAGCNATQGGYSTDGDRLVVAAGA